MQVFFSIEVDLGGQMAMIRRTFTSLSRRRTLTVTAQLIEQLLSRTIRWAAVTRRHDTAETVATFSIGHDPATQVEFRLRGIEVRVSTTGVGVPDVHHGTGQRFAGGVEHAPLHEQRHTRVEAIIETCLAFGQRRTGHVERAFDGAWRAAGFAGLFVFSVHQQVEVMLKTEPGDYQPGLLTRAQYVEVVNGFPELFRGHGEVFDDVDRITQDAVDQGLGPRIAGIVVQAAGLFEKLLDLGSVGDLDVYFVGFLIL